MKKEFKLSITVASLTLIGIAMCSGIDWQRKRYISQEVSQMKNEIKNHSLLGKEPEAVLRFLDKTPYDHSEYVIDKGHPEYSNIIDARKLLPIRTFSLSTAPGNWAILIEFKFSKEHRLKGYSVKAASAMFGQPTFNR